MTTSFKAAVGKVLAPEGFVGQGSDWTRVQDGCCDCISLQVVSGLGTTVNIESVDLVSQAILDEAIPPGSPGLKYPFTERIGQLMEGRLDRFWRRDADDPDALAAAVRTYVLPFLDRMHTLEGVKGQLALKAGNWRSLTARMYLAITLYRMGDTAGACEFLQNPPKRLSPAWVAQIEALRRRLCDTTPAGPPRER